MLRFAITDCASMPGKDPAARRQALVKRCGELAREGVEFLLVREKDLAAGELVELCREVLQAARATGMHVVVAGGRGGSLGVFPARAAGG